MGRMLLSLTGNSRTNKRQVALQKPLKESSEAMALCFKNSLDKSYINRNIINEVKGPVLVTDSKIQNVKQLIVKDFNEKCNEYFRELFHNVDIDNQEVTEPLVAEYNLRVRNILVEIQTDYSFRLHCCDVEYDDVAVWTDLLKISLRRSSTPLMQQTNHSVNPNPNFYSHPHPNNSFIDRSSTPDRHAQEEIHRLEEVANQRNRRSQHHHTLRGRMAVLSMPQFLPITGRPQCGYVRYNQNDRRYPNNRYNYRPKISYSEGESRATLAVAEALNKLTENFAKMQNQHLATVALSTIDWFDGTNKSNTMSWLEQVAVVAESTNQAPLEVGMAKLKGAPLCDVHKICNLTWPWL